MVRHNYQTPSAKWQNFVTLLFLARDNAACNVAEWRIKDVNELHSRIMTDWDKLDQRIIDTAVRQWRMHLHVCVKVKGGHSERKLSQ